jgi:hypothetical protein
MCDVFEIKNVYGSDSNWHLAHANTARIAIEFRAKQRTNHPHPLRDGREKTKAFLVGRGQPSTVRYKSSVARGEASRALIRKALGFSRHVSWQASGWSETSPPSA